MDSEEARWVTYAEAGELLGISAEAARQMARRRKWQRRTPNEPGAFAQVLLPVNPLPVRHRPALDGVPSGLERHQPAGGGQPVDQSDEHLDVLRSSVRTLASAVDGLREQLTIANQRADRAEQRADRLQVELDKARQPWWRRLRRRKPG